MQLKQKVKTMDFFENYHWHSSLELNEDIRGKKIIHSLTATQKNKDRFLKIASNSNFLIHKATKELWRISEDGTKIEPVFPDDVLTEDNL